MSKFKDQVIKVVGLIPYGQVASYGQVALMVGVPRAAIQVGYILMTSSAKYNLPWWRVVNNAGRISIKNSDYSPDMQCQLLQSEGVYVTKQLTLDIEKYRFRPSNAFIAKLELPVEYIFLINQKYLI